MTHGVQIWVLRLLRVGFAGLLLVAAWPKLADPTAFSRAVDAYRLLPPLGVYLTALLLPWLEWVVALALIGLPRLRLGAWAVAILLFAVFTAALASAALRGLDIQCGCFGGNSLVRWPDVAVRAVLLGVAAVGAALELRHAAGLARPSHPSSESSAAGCGPS